jgi:hypothetical protein
LLDVVLVDDVSESLRAVLARDDLIHDTPWFELGREGSDFADTVSPYASDAGAK